MAFKSWQSYWEFSRKVMSDQRYLHDHEMNDFLNEVLHTSKTRQTDLKQGSILWRAQLGVYLEGKVPVPHPPARMCPLPHIAVEGRVNPKGMPVLYLATDKETAMGEVRPWIGSEISVAQFRVLKNLKLIDCSFNHSSGDPFYYNLETSDFYEPDEIEREKSVWTHIDKAFSEPVVASENQAHYVPTQIIAELFRRNGLDGVIYKSLLGKGFNVALFDINTAELINCNLFKLKKISFDFVEAGNPYFMRSE